MSLHLIAAPDSDPEGLYVIRVWLPAGISVDSLCLDLLANFSDSKTALELCAHACAVRGLPSEKNAASPEETELLSPPKRKARDLDDLRAMAEETGAECIFLFEAGEWYYISGDASALKVRDLKLMKMESPAGPVDEKGL